MNWLNLGLVCLLIARNCLAQQGYNYPTPQTPFGGGQQQPGQGNFPTGTSPSTDGFQAPGGYVGTTPTFPKPGGFSTTSSPIGGGYPEQSPGGFSQRPTGGGQQGAFPSVESTGYPAAGRPSGPAFPQRPTATRLEGFQRPPSTPFTTESQPGQGVSNTQSAAQGPTGYPSAGRPSGPQFSSTGSQQGGFSSQGQQRPQGGTTGGYPQAGRPSGSGFQPGQAPGFASTPGNQGGFPQSSRPGQASQPSSSPGFSSTTAGQEGYPQRGRPTGPGFGAGQPSSGFPSGPSSRPQKGYPGTQRPGSQGYPSQGSFPGQQTGSGGFSDGQRLPQGQQLNGQGGLTPEQFSGDQQQGGEGGFGQPQEDEGDYSAIPGEPDVDYPILSSVPETSFSCDQQQYPGYYADVETRCQVFHICSNNKTYDFLCPNGTIFHQEYLVCVWWNQFDCNSAPSFFGINANIYDYSITGAQQQTGAIPAGPGFEGQGQFGTENQQGGYQGNGPQISGGIGSEGGATGYPSGRPSAGVSQPNQFTGQPQRPDGTAATGYQSSGPGAGYPSGSTTSEQGGSTFNQGYPSGRPSSRPQGPQGPSATSQAPTFGQPGYPSSGRPQGPSFSGSGPQGPTGGPGSSFRPLGGAPAGQPTQGPGYLPPRSGGSQPSDGSYPGSPQTGGGYPSSGVRQGYPGSQTPSGAKQLGSGFPASPQPNGYPGGSTNGFSGSEQSDGGYPAGQKPSGRTQGGVGQPTREYLPPLRR
ncbi:spidroin-2-like isoform X2 [Anthonomus grandis grandis]|nr:spidroin-2-like isoform X2 [Anthonomus grandis grandis]